MSPVPEERTAAADVGSAGRARLVVRRAIVLALVVLALAAGALIVIAHLSGEQVDLPFEYDGFD